jgi:hypothetical protein
MDLSHTFMASHAKHVTEASVCFSIVVEQKGLYGPQAWLIWHTNMQSIRLCFDKALITCKQCFNANTQCISYIRKQTCTDQQASLT